MTQAERPAALARPRHGPRAGFSLVELMVVVIIIGMIGGIAMVSWEALLPGQSFNSAVRRLSDVLNGARSDAIARNHEFRIYYDLDDSSYRIRTPYRPGGGIDVSDDDANRVWTDEVSLGAEGIEILQVTVSDETYSDGRVYVRFDPLGATSYHTVVLYHAIFDRTTTLEMLPLTGEIRFHEGLFERELAEERDFDR